MPDVTVTCPHCSAELTAPDEFLGEVVECPECQQDIQLPSPAQSPEKKLVIKHSALHSPKPTPKAETRSSSTIAEVNSPVAAIIAGIIILITFPIIGYYQLQDWRHSKEVKKQRAAAPAPARSKHDAVSAWTMCQSFVEDRLKAPRTTKCRGATRIT